MLQREEDGVNEPEPADKPQRDEPVAGWRLVQIQHLAGVKELQTSQQASTTAWSYVEL